jgi:molybdopterin-guanine dinucleotide biosynthesis protein A
MSDRDPGGVLPVGVILAGGLSRRLGRDKAAVVLGGRNLLARTVDLVGRLTPEVLVIGRDPAPQGLTGVDWQLDDSPGLGPAGGIATALRLTARPCLVLSCDLPLMNEATLARLLAARAERGPAALLTTFFQPHTGYIEALVAVYEPGALPVLSHALAAGRKKLSAIFPPHLRCHIPYGPDEAQVFFNINHPADLSLARQLTAAP